MSCAAKNFRMLKVVERKRLAIGSGDMHLIGMAEDD
jgi:hypothetical protein